MKINKILIRSPINIHYLNNLRRAFKAPFNKLLDQDSNKNIDLSLNQAFLNSMRKNLSIHKESASQSFKSISREKWLNYNLFKEKLGLPTLNKYRPKFTKVEKYNLIKENSFYYNSVAEEHVVT